MGLDGRKDIQSVKSAGAVLHTEVKARVLPSLQRDSKRCKANMRLHTYKHTIDTL